MKYISVFGWLLIVVPLVQAGASLQDARQEWLEGNYAEAREMYQALLKDDKEGKNRVAATLGLSRALESQGEYDKALKVVETLSKDLPKDADLLTRQAELLLLRGRLEESEKAVQAALANNKDQYLAHLVLGQIHRDRGEVKQAEEQFLWLIRAANQKKGIVSAEESCIVGLAALEHARSKHLTDQYQTIVKDYLKDVIKQDKLYWFGEYEAGRVFMEKHNKPAAFRAFEKALTVNPRSAEVLVCKGQMAASNFEFKDAEKYASQALKINPSYVPALCLMAEVHWFSGEIEPTVKLMLRAQTVNPRDEATLARLAACAFAKHDEKEFQAFIKQAQKNNPKCYTFFTDLASLLDQRKYYAEAEKYFEIAVKMQPMFSEAQTGLGMLYMRLGKEDEARKVLEEAFKADPFNVRVNNSLLVLAHLEKYDSLKTEHFIIRFDKKNDHVLANFMAIYLEDIYKELAAQFDYHPKGPFKIEIFNKHEMFSGRVVAVPDLHTIGACTGPLVAMVSPRDNSRVISRPFNWNRVIRHELVHVFNLQQTHGRVPHWFTEGLAVRYEGPNFPPTWHQLLAEKYNNNDLLNLDNVLLGFIRPRSQAQWQQAYMQSLFYVEYLTKEYGEKAVGNLLAAFAEGLDTGAALEKAIKVKKEVFEKGYREFLGEKVKNIALRPAQKSMTLTQLRDAHEKNPDDLDIAALLAEKYYQNGKRKDAKELVDKVLTRDAKNAKAATVKAMLLIDEGKTDVAIGVLDSLPAEELKDTTPLKLLAKLQLAGQKYNQAARTCEQGRKLDPNDPAWIGMLAAVYRKTNDEAKLRDIYAEVVKMDPDEFLPRKTLAKYHLKENNLPEAERYARMALEINVLDGDCQRILIQALEGQNKNAQAKQLRTVFGL